MVISRSITRNLRSTVFSLHRQELMAVTTLLPVYKQWGFSIILPFESQLYYQPYPISFTVGPFTNILTTVSDEVNGVAYTPTTVNWYKDKFGIVCDYYSNGAYVNPKSVTFISLGI